MTYKEKRELLMEMFKASMSVTTGGFVDQQIPANIQKLIDRIRSQTGENIH